MDTGSGNGGQHGRGPAVFQISYKLIRIQVVPGGQGHGHIAAEIPEIGEEAVGGISSAGLGDGFSYVACGAVLLQGILISFGGSFIAGQSISGKSV